MKYRSFLFDHVERRAAQCLHYASQVLMVFCYWNMMLHQKEWVYFAFIAAGLELWSDLKEYRWGSAALMVVHTMVLTMVYLSVFQ